MTNCIENDHAVFLNDKNRLNSSKTNFYNRWWYQQYKHQHLICKIMEENYFYKITIILLIFDCLFVIIQTIIDFTKVKSECIQKKNSLINKSKHEIEILMAILHYMSIGILTLFVLEFVIKIYVFGRDFWNINKRKMEYFDGFIVIFSYFIDIYFIKNEKNYFMEYRFEMITIIRLWRIIRIINSVVQWVINEEHKKRDHLNTQYIITIEQFLDILKYKTNDTQNKNESFDQIVNQCQDYFDLYKENYRQITSTIAIEQFSEQLQTLNISIYNSDFSILIEK